MNIHDLNTKTLTDPAYVAFDDGTDTYKVEFNDVLEEKTAEAVAAADLTQNQVAFTSGDGASPTAWTNVSVITTGSTLATLFNRISTMVKNVRYLWSLMQRALIRDTASLDTGTDLNDISMGIHYCAGSKTYSNMPGNATYGTVIHIAGSYPVQMFFTTSSMYYRMYANSQWYAWNRIQIQG